MRLTLVYPSVGRKENRPYVRAWQMQPLSVALLAGLTPPEVEVRFYDDRLDCIPFDEPTDLVAMSVETFTALGAAQELSRLLHRLVLPGDDVLLLIRLHHQIGVFQIDHVRLRPGLLVVPVPLLPR